MISIDPSEVSTRVLHGYLLSAVAPRPIAFASTVDEDGRPNLAPFSFFNVFSANPPIAIFSPARRGTNNTTKHTFENVKKIREVVINVVNYNLVQQCSLASTDFPEGVSEFTKTGLTPVDSVKVKPPRVKESPVQLECMVKDVVELGDQGGAGNLVICEIVHIHISPDVVNADGQIDTRKMDLVGRCGANWYTRVNDASLFEVAKPLAQIGIGVDAIPQEIRVSRILTGNHLAQLGNVEQLPDETSVNEYKLIELAELFIELQDEPATLESRLHQQAADLLDKGMVNDAWKTLLAFNNG
ncbi:MAG: flavin reductase family protein [Flavobacteriales bacterium]|nr:flavin reductase family protein [Flavobacteriales bacterium]